MAKRQVVELQRRQISVFKPIIQPNDGFPMISAIDPQRVVGEDHYQALNWALAGVAELADALDSKSSARKGVWVRVPPSVLIKAVLLFMKCQQMT